MFRVFRSDIYENLKMALATLRGNKLRSFLTVIGVMIGVITVMAIASIISGFDMAFKKEVESWGTRSIFLYKFDIGFRTSAPTKEERTRPDLTFEDAAALAQLPAVEIAVPFLDISNDRFGQALIVKRNGKTSGSIQLEGTIPDYERAGLRIITEGRWFTQLEEDTGQEVCIIGASVAEDFFPFESPVDQTLEIGGRQFRVVGLMEKKEQAFGGGGGDDDQNKIIQIPFSVAHRLKPDSHDVFILAVGREGRLDEAKDQIADLLRVRRQVPFGAPNNFGMETAESIVSNFRSIIASTAIVMVAISSVGLMVGGIGVMNIMLVSVTERTREIGTRKAIGARRRDIMWQFLIEAMTLTGFGGLVGLAIGYLITLLIRLAIPSYVPLWAPVGGFLVSVSIGLVFGLWPAWKAARLDPIEALRYE